MPTNDIEWQRITLGDNEWQRVTTSVTTNENEQKRIRASKREWFWFQNETIHAMCNYNVFSNINYLQIAKFLINLLTKETAWKQGEAMLWNSLGQFRKALIKIGKWKFDDFITGT